MMKAHSQSLIVILILLWGGVWQMSHATAPVLFHSVVIESRPKGGGFAHKTVKSDGTVIGAHMSGPPDAVRVYESKADLTADDMAKLNLLVSELQFKLPKGNTELPDKKQKAEGYLSVIVHLDNKRTITFHTTVRGKQTRFEYPAVQAIWELVSKYRAGAW